MEAARFSETVVPAYRSTQCRIPERLNAKCTNCCEQERLMVLVAMPHVWEGVSGGLGGAHSSDLDAETEIKKIP
jgi:hypothetical protein